MKKLTFGLQAGSYVLIACIVLMGCPLPNPVLGDPPDRTAPVPVTEPPAGITLPTGSTFLSAENADSIDYESTSLTIAFNEAIQAVEGATAEITLAEDRTSGVQASPSEQTFNANDPMEVTIAGTILTLREVTLNAGTNYMLTIPTGVLQDAAMNPVVQTIEFATNEEDISERDDHGNDRASATALTLGSATNGNIEVVGDADWFSVVLSEAGTLTVFSTGSTDTAGELHNGTGTQLATDDNSGMGNNFSLSASVTAGTYYIQVGESGDNATGTYTIQANFTAAPVNPLLGTWSGISNGFRTNLIFTENRYTQTSFGVPFVGTLTVNCDYTYTSNRMIPRNCVSSFGTPNASSASYTVSEDGNTLTLAGAVFTKQ